MQVMWDYDEHLPIALNVQGGSPAMRHRQPNKVPRDKNWSGFDQVGHVTKTSLDSIRWVA